MTSPGTDVVERYHGLDGLRGFAMLLGIVLHGSLPYFSRTIGIESIWPADDDQTLLLFVVFAFIHSWRMPVFFLLAGFFAHLVLARRSDRAFALDRLTRIGVPLVLFGALMALVIPPIWIYGWTGEFSLAPLAEVLAERPDLDSSGDIVAHLWFLYHLLLMYGALLALRLLAGVARRRAGGRVSPSVAMPSRGRRLGDLVYTRIPLLLALGATALLILRAGDESKPIWPLNVPDVLYGLLFFAYGYGLYSRRELIGRLQGSGTLLVLWAVASLLFFCYLVLLGVSDELSRGEAEAGAVEFVWFVTVVCWGTSGVLFSAGFVGLFEQVLRSAQPWIRFLADSSYWIYLIHLPLVALLTFALAHLDRQGRLEGVTGFTWSAELKFSVACLATGGVGIVTYRYLVRGTPLGRLLNGKRPASSRGS